MQHEAPQIDREKLGEAIDSAIQTKVIDSVHEKSFQLLERTGTIVEAYLTEQPSILSLSFKLSYALQDSPETEGLYRTEATVMVIGACSYSLDSGEVTDFRISKMEFRWLDENTQEQKRANLYAYVADTLFSHKTVKYEFRTPLLPLNDKGDVHT